MEIREEDLAYVNQKLDEMVASGSLDAVMEKLIRYRYGVGEKPLAFKQLSKVMKMPRKKLVVELQKAEKQVFNMLKYEIVD